MFTDLTTNQNLFPDGSFNKALTGLNYRVRTKLYKISAVF